MDSNGRQRSATSSLTLPVSSTFRRLPSLGGRSPFRRADKSRTPSPAPDDAAPSGPAAASPPPPSGLAHTRGSTFPSLSRVLVDDSSLSSAFFASTSRIQEEAAAGVNGHNPLGPSAAGVGLGLGTTASAGNLLPPSRSSSLAATPSPGDPSAAFSPLSHPTSQLPRSGRIMSAAGSSSVPTPAIQAFSPPQSYDLEPITYPAHLAQTRPPEPAGPFARGIQVAHAQTGSISHSPSFGVPGTGGPPTGVPRRKESMAPGGAAPVDGLGLGGIGTPGSSGPNTPSERRPNGHGSGGPLNGSSAVNGYASDLRRPSDARRPSMPRHKSKDDAEYSTGNGTGDETVVRRRRADTVDRRAAVREDAQGEREASGGEPAGPSDRAEREQRRRATRSRTALAPLVPRLSLAKVPRAPASAMYFSPVPAHGRPPAQPLRAHTGTLVGDRIWVLGGVDGKSHCWKGVAWFDTETLQWGAVEHVGESLPPLRAHTTTLVGDKLYIFGGGDGPVYSNEVWVFDTVTHRFSKPNIATPRHAHPLPRRAHTTVLYRNFLVVFGGGNGQAALNDLWALDVSDPDRLVWHEWRARGAVPQRKGYHSANLVGDKMVVFGGSDGHASFADVHVLDLQSLTWTLVQTEVQHNRLSHTSTQVGSYLFVIGGHNGTTYAHDVLLFNLAWEAKVPKGVPPPGRGYHTAVLHDARIFVSGGYNGVSVFDDVWALDLSAGAYLPQVTTFEVDEHAEHLRHIEPRAVAA